jgi:hypothetical protein
MVGLTHDDFWARFERWARRYASASDEFVSDHEHEGDWLDPRWLAFATQWELESPEAWEGIGDLEDEVRRRVQQKLAFLHAYLVDIAPDEPAFMSKKFGVLPWQYPSKCDQAWGFWFQQNPDGDLEPGSVPGFQELEGQLFLPSPEGADFASIRSVLPFDHLSVRRPRGEAWTRSEAYKLLSVLASDLGFDGYDFEPEIKGLETPVLRLSFQWQIYGSSLSDQQKGDAVASNEKGVGARTKGDALEESSPQGKLVRQALRYQAAKSNASVGTIQATIERLLKLPEGSVKLVNPDRTFSRRDQSIKRLRERWDKV